MITREGRNDFIIEYNETEEGFTDEEDVHLLYKTAYFKIEIFATLN